ncbi:hypothetical protein H310_07703 [Aphanomyces invadans]|uniref:Uncharacterized protein n=1 Tax=Aphanomyces invadans TaxID=157072 RepID=A0A024U1N7_9STRA|nr:hypothetical protein H310_07703 [Aphanomyces invadans]ETW00336.1 hypothetical protein H310_07703 [Aphanomyces invadans]|eukprot:XP_008871361.1 hypothetical protein H310_07703 [Aphanomyces invadans]
MATTSTCCFNGCSRPVLFHGKCKLHRYRHHCSVPLCMNQAYARRLCVAHGGRRECLSPGCLGNARSRGYCCKHSDINAKTMTIPGGMTRSPRVEQAHKDPVGGRIKAEHVRATAVPVPSSSWKDTTQVDDPTACLNMIEVEAMKFVQCWDDVEIGVIDGFLSDLPMSSVMWCLQ